MKQFLKIVAEDLYSRFNDSEKGLSGITVVFPNRRARLFFDRYLSECCDTPLWSPQYTTIEELFQNRSGLRVADRIELVSILHQVYCRQMGSTETLDSFWPWGELLLADFDDVDRNLAHSKELFQALRDQNELSDLSFLTDEQKELLGRFFGEVDKAGTSDLKEKLGAVWRQLGAIYDEFTGTLRQMGLAYSGMLQRDVVTNLDSAGFCQDHYAFVGFNSLDKAEKELFRAIQSRGKALFYWDYDIAYTRDGSIHEAGHFMRDNLREFPSELPESLFDNLSSEHRLTIVETSTDSAQARYLPEWIDSVGCEKADSDMAVVLCDETLLQPVLHCLPPDRTDNVNITMGFPMSGTPLYGLVTSLVELQRNASRHDGRFALNDIERVLTSPLICALSCKASELLAQLRADRRMYPEMSALQVDGPLSAVFSIACGNNEMLGWLLDILHRLVAVFEDESADTLFKPMNQEVLFRCYTQVNRLRSLMADGKLDLQPDTLCRLLRSMLTSATVPFHGEPVIGMQVMGLIETRNLDFKHVLLLSAAEGTLPGVSGNASFIPYNVRVAFGLTTMKDKSAVASYNFYHLLQRAESVTMVYNGNADAPGIGKGQISRYLLQLKLSGMPVRMLSQRMAGGSASDSMVTADGVEKTESVLRQLCHRYDFSNTKTYLSPSALKKYLACPLSFYLAQVAGLKKPDDTVTEIDNAMFGTLLHKSAELVYEELADHGTDRVVTAGAIEKVADNRAAIGNIVCRAFNGCFFKKEVALSDYSGSQTVVHGVICKYLMQLLKMDMNLYAPFTYLKGESDDYETSLQVADPLNPDRTMKVRLKGIIDRMDMKDGVTRIVDYKTGSPKDSPKDLDAVFATDGKSFEHAFQIFYYAYVLSRQKAWQGRKIAPTLLYTRTTSKPVLEDLYYKVGDHAVKDFDTDLGKAFAGKLQNVVEEIFNPAVPFRKTESDKPCKYCDFYMLCHGND